MKKVIDYNSREIIFYKFICNDPTIISTYVGHTINFTDRKGKHKRTCYNEKSKKYNFLLYKTIRENGGWDNWTIFEIERKIVASKQDALKHEQELIDLQVEKLNMYNAVKNVKEIIINKKKHSKIYRDKHKEQIAISKKAYCDQNKEQIAISKKAYRDQNKEQIAISKKAYRDQNKEQIAINQKKYRDQNKNEILQNKKLWWDQNKEQINLKRREKTIAKKELNLMSKEDKY